MVALLSVLYGLMSIRGENIEVIAGEQVSKNDPEIAIRYGYRG